MPTPISVVDAFIAALYGGDPATARTYLADDCRFTGPAAEYASAEAYLRASAHVAPLVKCIERRVAVTEGSDVCVVHDLQLNHNVRTLSIAEWYHVNGTTITSIRTFFDTAPFVAAGAKDAAAAGAAAHTDPVCRMVVPVDSAAATRDHGGKTYYFCNGGCAMAFEKQPDRYV